MTCCAPRALSRLGLRTGSPASGGQCQRLGPRARFTALRPCAGVQGSVKGSESRLPATFRSLGDQGNHREYRAGLAVRDRIYSPGQRLWVYVPGIGATGASQGLVIVGPVHD